MKTIKNIIILYFAAFSGLYGLMFFASTVGIFDPTAAASKINLLLAVLCLATAVALSFKSTVGCFLGFCICSFSLVEQVIRVATGAAQLSFSTSSLIVLWAALAYGIFTIARKEHLQSKHEEIFALPDFEEEPVVEEKKQARA